MIAFATTVEARDRFNDRALPGLRRAAEPDSPIAEITDPDSAEAAFNEALDAFGAYDELEALVLLDEDTELLDADFCARIRSRLDEDEAIAVIAVGADEHASDPGESLPLVLSPWAVRNLRFAMAETGDDLFAQARAAGRRVVCEDLAVTRHQSALATGARAAGDSLGDNYYEWARPELQALVPHEARRILDVGCGRGALGSALKARQGAEVAGIEVVPEAAAEARRRLDEVLVADLDGVGVLPFPEGHFDVALFGDVLEHLRDPHRLLRLVREHLAPDGLIVCSIPNIKHWSVVLPLLLEDRFEYEDAGLLDRTHVHFFTLREIGMMMRACGFAVDRVAVNAIDVPEQHLEAAHAAVAASADPAQQFRRLGVYQYLVVAKRT